MKVVAFNGSPRKDGNTAVLLRLVLAEIESEDIETEYVQIGGKSIRGCTACMKCKEKKNSRCAIETDIVNDCIMKILEADGVLLGSPTYFADITPEMKALIDRTGHVSWNNDNLLARKVGAAVVSARRAGALHAFDTISNFFLINGMIVPGSTYWSMGFGLDKGDVVQDDEGVQSIRQLGRNMAWLLKRISDE